MITQDLGIATAYGYAKSKGYTGTEAEFAELMASYASTAQTAIEAADRAVEANTAAQSAKTDASASKTAAQTAAQTATSKASEAVTAADTATTKASEASTSADTASTAAQTATDKASIATTAASTATTKASEAAASETAALSAKTDAESARDAAAQSASEAAASAESIDPETLEHKAYGAYVVESASGVIASFADGADSIPMKDVLVHIEPVQAGSGDPSPDNVRPISGWTGCELQRTGKNLCPIHTMRTSHNGIDYTVTTEGIKVHGTATSASYSWIDRINTYKATWLKIPAGSHTFSVTDMFGTSQNDGYVVFMGFDIDGTAVTSFVLHGGNRSIVRTYTKPVGLYYGIYVKPGLTVDTVVKIQVELGSTATDYEPYSGQTYDITFPTEAGTVYGGTLDVTSGVLMVTDAQIASYAGETLPGEWISDRDVYVSGTTPTTGAQVVYKLATPITYTLTPQEITSLLGTNNVWADMGDSEVEYRADTKMYITKKITEAVSALS